MNIYKYFLVGLSCVLSGCSHIVETSVDIDAEPSQVWSFLSDASSFEDWNPVHYKMVGDFKVGQTVRVHVRKPSGETIDFDSTIKEMEPEKKLRQGGGTWGIFTFDHSFVLDTIDGGTRVTQRERFAGLGLIFFDTGWVEEAYPKVTNGLKIAVEKKYN